MKLKPSGRMRMSYWQLIFNQSKVNGAPYNDDALRFFNWNWPRNTYLQRRRSQKEPLSACCPRDFRLDTGREAAKKVRQSKKSTMHFSDVKTHKGRIRR